MKFKNTRVILCGVVAALLASIVIPFAGVAEASRMSPDEALLRHGARFDQEPAGPATPMTPDRLLSVVIPSVCGLPRARLVDGAHPLAHSRGPWAAIVGLRPWDDDARLQAIVGDLTGDRVADGLIVLACSPGGNGYFEKALAYRSDGHFLGPIPVHRYIPPSQYAIGFDDDWTAIIAGAARFRVYSYRPNDSHCCPSRITALRFRWTVAGFQLVGPS